MEATTHHDHLRRAGIEPWTWVVNQSLNSLDLTTPLLRTRATAAAPLLHQVRDELATRSALVPLRGTEPRGVRALATPSEHPHARV